MNPQQIQQMMKQAQQMQERLQKEMAALSVEASAGGGMEIIWTGTVREARGPFAAGQKLRARFAVFMEFQGGRIVRQRNYDCFDPW